MKVDVKIKSLIAALLFLAPFVLNAQTLEDAQKAYNAAVTANNEGNLPEAITQFNVCLEACDYLVEEQEDETAEELQMTVQGVVPKLYLQLGSDQLQNQQITEGLENIYKAKEAGNKFGDKETVEKANKVIPQVHYKLAAQFYKEEKLDEAIAECDKAIAADADYTNAYYIKAAILKKKDDASFKTVALAGIAVCKRINDTKNEQKIVDLGYKTFLKKGVDAKGASKYDEAISDLNSALEFSPNDATAFYLLASIYNAQGKNADAIAAGQKAIEFETGGDEAKAKIYMIIAESQAKKGDNAAACAAYKKAAVGQYAESANYQIVHVLKCQ
jgi:tetratricopeptide (TPR) repeat protein